MKKRTIERCFSKQMKWKEGAQLLGMHPKAFSRLKKNYLKYGEMVLVGRKPGPKPWSPPANKTPEDIEEIVERLAIAHPHFGPQPLADKLYDNYQITKDQSTIWRILKRRKVRYTQEYKRWKDNPKLYCLDLPGEELQLDACYPYGRARKVASFDAIDDCSRHVYGKCYDRETAENAILFVDELIQRSPFAIQRIRVDNRYGKTFVKHCNSLGIEIIQNEPYSPEQNGKIERFHKTLKREFFYRHCSYTDSLESLNYKYSQWLAYYNYHRRHSGFGMNRLTPAQKITQTLLKATANTIIMSSPQKVTGTLQEYIFCYFMSWWYNKIIRKLALKKQIY